MVPLVWRVEPLASPPWRAPCAACHALTRHLATEQFRVNANGARHDVWLLYRCAGCGATKKRRVAERVRVEALGERLARYLANDAALARAHAFAWPTCEPLPYRVVREPVGAGPLHARIEQPCACGVRWDRFLARELGGSRGEVARAFARGALRVDGLRSLAQPVRDGQELRVLESLAGG